MAEEGEQKNLPLFLTKLKQITENILWMSECLEMKARLQSDILIHSVLNQVSVSKRNIDYVRKRVAEHWIQNLNFPSKKCI